MIPCVNAAIGGPAASVTGLATALAREGVDVSLASLDYPEHGPLPRMPGVRARFVRPSAAGKLLRGWSPALRRTLEELATNGVDVVHSHALWMAPGVDARRIALRHGVPLVVSPRGMLQDWSLRRRSWRKALALGLYEKANLESAALLHATSDDEAQALRDFGCTRPVAVIPNGVDTADAGGGDRTQLEDAFPQLRGQRWLLFLGRLHEKKGLPMLLDAWAQLAGERPDWHLVIAGPDLDGQGAQFAASAMREPRLAGRVTFTGMLHGELKAAALDGAEVMVLPTLSENFGVSVVEALAAGVPVITTRGAPWSSLVEHGCGWWVEPEGKPLRDALAAATALPPDRLAAMGVHGRALAARYSWPGIAKQFREVYTWVSSGGPRPACIA